MIVFLLIVYSLCMSQLTHTIAFSTSKKEDEAATILLPLPPRNLMFMADKSGYMEYLNIGVSNFKMLCEFGLDLSKDDAHLLDMGSGYGRLAAGILVSSMEGKLKGNYTGMDILRRHVTWCQTYYRNLYPGKMNFIHMDVYNSRYNPSGSIQPTNYRIPVSDGSYTFISLFSVFTHMHEQEIYHYLTEFTRVLRAGGKVVATVFLYNKDRMKQTIESTYGAFEFNDHTRIKDKADPLFAIVYEEKWFVDYIVKPSGLHVEKIIYGTAIGDPDDSNYKIHGKRFPHLFQDLMVLQKSRPA